MSNPRDSCLLLDPTKRWNLQYVPYVILFSQNHQHISVALAIPITIKSASKSGWIRETIIAGSVEKRYSFNYLQIVWIAIFLQIKI
jgi:hypothetical protein